MKFSFSDKFVNSNSFIDLCNITRSYGFDGIEISNAEIEKELHLDSIFRSSLTVDAKRKLVNRHISLPSICYPNHITENTSSDEIVKCVEYAILASIPNVIITFEKLLKIDIIKPILMPAIKLAETSGVSILIETSGELASTQKVLDIISALGFANVKVCWNIRQTYFVANEQADKTIQTLGAYIAYVRIGDKKQDKNVLIGEGELPVKDFMNALKSLNYDGFVSVMDSDEICSADILLTHFKSYMS